MHLSEHLFSYLPEEYTESEGFPIFPSNLTISDKVFILKYYLDKVIFDGVLGATLYINEVVPLHDSDSLSDEVREILDFWNSELETSINPGNNYQLLLFKREDKYFLSIEKSIYGSPDFSMPEIELSVPKLLQLLRIYPRVSVYNYNTDYIWQN